MVFVVAAVAGLDSAARARVLAAAGIPADLLATLQARVPAEAFSALWLAVARERDDEFFGLDARRMKVGSFALLCQAAIGCARIYAGLKRVLRGFAVFLDDLSGELVLEGDEAVLRLHNRITGAARRRFAEETFMVLVHGLTCWLAGRRIPVTSAHFAFARPDHAAEYRVMFSDALAFDAPHTELRFDARWLALPVLQNQNLGGLRTFLQTAPQSVFLKYRNEDSWTARVRRLLRDGLAGGDWPGAGAVAGALHVAPTTLRRKLEAEGASFQGIKDELRRDAAIHHLCHSAVSAARIGELVGFAEASAFYRAFKKWTGVQPGEYRAARTRVAEEAGRSA
ncbi:MAG: AraC family transcriptional regulator [Burkholderiales bacterium]